MQEDIEDLIAGHHIIKVYNLDGRSVDVNNKMQKAILVYNDIDKFDNVGVSTEIRKVCNQITVPSDEKDLDHELIKSGHLTLSQLKSIPTRRVAQQKSTGEKKGKKRKSYKRTNVHLGGQYS